MRLQTRCAMARATVTISARFPSRSFNRVQNRRRALLTEGLYRSRSASHSRYAGKHICIASWKCSKSANVEPKDTEWETRLDCTVRIPAARRTRLTCVSSRQRIDMGIWYAYGRWSTRSAKSAFADKYTLEFCTGDRWWIIVTRPA